MILQGIRLLVEDFDKAFMFYRDILELEVTWGELGDVYASFKTDGGVLLSIFQAQLMDESLNVKTIGKRRVADTGVIILAVDDVNVTYEKLINKVEVLMPPRDMAGWGCRCFHIRDTEGNLIEFNSELSKDKWNKDLLEAAKKYR